MKELLPVAEDLQRQLASGQLFAPTFEEMEEMHRQYIELMRLGQPENGVRPRDDQSSPC